MEITRLHTEGNKRKNDFGEIVNLQGVCIADLAFGYSGGQSRPHWDGDIVARLDLLMELLPGTNVIRIAIGGDRVWNLPEEVAQQVDIVKDWCVLKHKWFFINSHGGWSTAKSRELVNDPTPIVKYHLFWLERYRNVKEFVGLEVWNEPWWKPVCPNCGSEDINTSVSPVTCRTCNFQSSDKEVWGNTQQHLRKVMVAVRNAIYAADPTLLVFVECFGYWRIDPDYINNPLGPQTIYGWDTYWSKWSEPGDPTKGYYHGPYATGDYVTGKERMRNCLLNENCIKQDNLPVMNLEFGWLIDDNLVAVKDFYSQMNEFGSDWVCFMWWGNPQNLGIFDWSTNKLLPYGEVMKQFMMGGEITANRTFKGSVSKQASSGETVTLVVTKPDGTKDTFTSTTNDVGAYSTTRAYVPSTTQYSVKVSIPADVEYKAAEAETTFTVDLQDRTISISVEPA